MSDLAEEATLLLEPCPVPGVVGVHQDGVEEFGRTGQLVERGLTHLSVRSRAEGGVSHQSKGAETELLLSHHDRSKTSGSVLRQLSYE